VSARPILPMQVWLDAMVRAVRNTPWWLRRAAWLQLRKGRE
jgi:hypothetical protein